MIKSTKSNFWGTVANLILRNRLLILITISVMTLLLASQWKNMRFTFTEANLLPDTHPENIHYEDFIKTFGEEGNLIVIAIKDDSFFTEKIFNEWVLLNNKIDKENFGINPDLGNILWNYDVPEETFENAIDSAVQPEVSALGKKKITMFFPT